MIPDWAPSIHPLVIHFPIVLIIVALTLDLLSYIPRLSRLQQIASWLYVAAGAAALVAFLSGRKAADLVLATGAAVGDLNDHADWGMRTAWTLGVVALLRVGWILGNARLGASATRWTRAFLTLLGVASVLVVFETAEHGARLVYVHGLGTSIEQPDPFARFDNSPTASGRPEALADGSWRWSAPSDLLAFSDGLQFLEGDDSRIALGAVLRDTTQWVSVTTSGPVFVVFPAELHEVEVLAQLDLSDFDGNVAVTYNTRDASNYGALRIGSDGAIGQVLVADGTDNVLDSGQIQVGDAKAPFRVVSAGTHYRAYAGGSLIAHGHGKAGLPGRVGLRMDGTGTLLIRRLAAISTSGHEH